MTSDPERLQEAKDAAADAVSVPRSRRRGRFAGLSALVLVGLLVSPPGQAVAERIGELVGIGDESSVSESNLRDPRLDEQQERVGPAIVTATGTVPETGERFEILAWAARHKRPDDLPPGVGAPTKDGELVSCMGQVYPDIGRQETGKVCIGQGPEELHVFGIGSHIVSGEEEYADNAPYSIVGTASADARRVEVTYTDASGEKADLDAHLGVMDEAVMEKTGAETPFSFFIAFLPYDGAERGDPRKPSLTRSPTLESVKVTSYDEDGSEIASQDAGAQYARALEQRERMLRVAERRNRLLEAARLAACQSYEARLPRSICDRARRIGRADPDVAELAPKLRLEEVSVGVEVKYPGGRPPLTIELESPKRG